MTKPERRFTALAIGAAVVFTARVVAWRFGYEPEFWPPELPPVPEMDRFAGLELHAWWPLVALVVTVAVVGGGIVQWGMGWRVTAGRKVAGWLAVALPLVVCFQTAAVYGPFYGWTERRVDRVAGVVEEPVIVVRRLAVSVVVTLALTALFLCVVRLRRTPAGVRSVALTVTATLTGILLHLWWIQAIFPMTNRWVPSNWHSPEMMAPFRPCRGAMLWTPEDASAYAREVGLVDDVWARFSDPRREGEQIWAVSVSGVLREEYLWLDRAEAERLRVRQDDPAVMRCDERPRADAVARAAWHRLGFDW